MGLLSKTETTQKAGLLNKAPVSVPQINITANSTPQTSFKVPEITPVSIKQAPKPKEESVSFPLTGTTISQSKTVDQAPIKKIVNKIKNQTIKDIVSGVIEAPRNFLFGDEQKRQEIKTLEEQGVKVPFSEKIVSEGFLPSLGMSQTEKIDKKATDLIRKGVNSTRAYEISAIDTLSRAIPKSVEDMERKKLLDKEYEKLALTDQEKDTLRFTNSVQSIFEGLDVAGIIPVGATVNNIGRNVTRIAKSSDAGVIANELTKIGIAKDKVDDLAVVLSKTEDPETVSKIITESIAKAPEEKAGLLNRGAKEDVTEVTLEQEAKGKTLEEFRQKVKGGATQYGDYTPDIRATVPAGYKNISELGIDPEEMVTVYRGIDDISGKAPRKINDGDFVTTDFDSALSYTGDPKDVVEMQVKAKHLYNSEPRDFTDEPFYTGAEYIYTSKNVKNLPTDKELADIWTKANAVKPEAVKEATSLTEEAQKYKTFEEFNEAIFSPKERLSIPLIEKYQKELKELVEQNKYLLEGKKISDIDPDTRRKLSEKVMKDFFKKAKESKVVTRTPEELAKAKERLAKRMESIPSKKPSPQYATIPKEVTSVEAKAEEYLSRVPSRYEKDVLSLPDSVERAVTDVKNKVNVLDYIRTPDRVLEKIGFAKEAKAVRKGYEAYLKELPENIDKITEWSKRVPDESNEKIFRYLDGKKDIVLTKEELAVATEIQTWLKEWAKRLKLPEDKQITHYITHIFDRELVKKEFDEDLAKIITDRIPSSVYDPFLESRLGKQGYKENTWEALDAYAKRATRKVNMDDAIEMINKKAGSTLDMAKVEASQFKYLQRYVNNINLRPTELDNLIDNSLKSVFGYKYGNRPVTYLTRLLRQLTYRGMLGLNPASALRNLSQGVNTYAKLGEKYTALGYLGLFKKGALDELKDVGVLADTFIQDRALSSTKKAMEKVDKGLWAMFQTAETINRGSAYFGAKAKALSQGMSEEQAIEYAKKLVRDTQFAFGSIDTPVALQNDLIKTLTQFQSYTVKQIEFLTEMAKNKEFVGLLRYGIGGLAFTYTIGQMFGMKPEQLLPMFRFDTPPSLKFPVEVTKAILDSPDAYNQDRDAEQKLSDIAKSTIGLIPAGNQIKKTVEGLLSVQRGGSFDKGGNLQYEAPETTEGKIQAILFGKSSTEKAQSYYNRAEENEKLEKDIQPFYDQIQELKKAGKEEEAIFLYDSLGEKGKEVYKRIKSKSKAEETKKGKKEVLPIFREIRKLKDEGKAEEALQMYESLSDDQKNYYQLLKKQLDKDGSIPEDLPEKPSKFKENLFKAFGVQTASAMENPKEMQIDEKVAIPQAISKVIEQSENIAPMIDKKYIQALVKQESSDGTDDRSRKYGQGKYGWLVGFTVPTYKDIVKKAKTQKKYKNLLDSMAGFDTPENAMRSALIYSQFLMRDHTKEQETGKREWKNINATQLYKLYNGGGSPKGVKLFEEKFNAL